MKDQRWAIFSDVHSNLEGLQSVLAEIAEQGIGQLLCLGDVVGYNAQPEECVERLRQTGCPVILGNHDQMAMADELVVDPNMNKFARAGIEHSAASLSASSKDWLKSLPRRFFNGHFEAVHASLCLPHLWLYINNDYEAYEHFKLQEAELCFCGHTHQPSVSVFHPDTGDVFTSEPGPTPVIFQPGLRYLINVGSVGQPRDGDPRACYGILDLDSRSFEFRRVTYDIPTAQQKIIEAKLPLKLAFRLEEGS